MRRKKLITALVACRAVTRAKQGVCPAIMILTIALAVTVGCMR